MKTVFILLIALAAGCLPRVPPEHYSIDSDLPAAHQEVIRDVIDARCAATGWCPTEAAWADRGRIMLVDEIIDPEYVEDVCPSGAVCEVDGRNDGDNIRMARNTHAFRELDIFWHAVAHELGHFCSGHTKSGLMAAINDGSTEIDTAARRAWFDGCGEE